MSCSAASPVSLRGYKRSPAAKRHSILTVALTGGIACGKSVIAEVLKKKGCYIHHADLAARRLMSPERSAWKAIVSHFGRDILNPDRTINRAKLAAIIFSRKKERLFLNSLIHPLVLRKKKELIRRLERKGRVKIFVSEAALTVEAGFSGFFDKVIVVYCPEEMQIRRLRERDGITQREARKKIEAQLPAKEKLKFADYVIRATGTEESARRRAEDVYALLLRDYREKAKKKKPDGVSPSARPQGAGS